MPDAKPALGRRSSAAGATMFTRTELRCLKVLFTIMDRDDSQQINKVSYAPLTLSPYAAACFRPTPPTALADPSANPSSGGADCVRRGNGRLRPKARAEHGAVRHAHITIIAQSTHHRSHLYPSQVTSTHHTTITSPPSSRSWKPSTATVMA